MEKYVFIYRDKKLGVYGDPILTNEDKEHVIVGTTRGLAHLDENQKLAARDNALYYLGTFDDISGKFDLLLEPEKLLDCEDYIKIERSEEVCQNKDN